MGLIIRQTIKGSIWTYLGVIVGFVTVSYLFPKYLPPDIIGLFGLLVSYSTLFAQFSSLGVTGITARLFPYFRNNQNNHFGFLFLSLLIMTLGFALFLVLFLFFSPVLIESNIEKSKLFSDYVYLLVPLTFFTLLFVYFDTYNKVLYDAVYGTVLQEFVQRVLILGITVLFIFKFINLNQLVPAYAFAISIKAVIIFIHLFRKGEISFKPYLSFIDKNLRKEIISVGIYSIIGGFGSAVVFSIDKILVNQMIDLESTGIYTIAFSFGILVSIPSRSLLKISSTVIAEAWKKNDLEQIKSIYRKSCLNQFIIGGLLFIGIWANIDNIFKLIGNDYLEGKWVIFFIGLGFLIDMATGVNGYIIILSKYYRISVVFVSVLIVLVVVTNLIFIPLWGITGAAVATMLSLLLNNAMRYIYLLVKFGMQPFDEKFLLVILSLLVAYLAGFVIPQMNLIPDIILRSGLITVVFGILIVSLKISRDINEIVNLSKRKIIKSKSKD